MPGGSCGRAAPKRRARRAISSRPIWEGTEMEIPIQIVVTGLTMGSMYALAAVGLSLIFGTLGMFNMAHGMFMTLGAYAVYAVASSMGLSMALAVPLAMLA